MKQRSAMFQTTVKRTVRAQGAALHAGATTRIALHPAETGAGIVFRRSDLADDNLIKADPRNVVGAIIGVRLRNAAGAEAMTVEHFLAAASLAGLDNAVVEIAAAELPIFDGSLRDFAALIDAAGLEQHEAERRFIRIGKPARVEEGDRFVEIAPGSGRRISLSIDYPAPAIGRRAIELDLDDAATRARIIFARTFCTRADIDGMRAMGLARGGSLDNAIVVDGARILNDGPLRDPEEFALHKAADLVGDLALLGAPFEGLVTAHKTGHELNTRLSRRILEEAAA